jgi:hypothetical protein
MAKPKPNPPDPVASEPVSAVGVMEGVPEPGSGAWQAAADAVGVPVAEMLACHYYPSEVVVVTRAGQKLRANLEPGNVD